jgi:nicotinate-nucleotide adenylyltransferase
MDRNIQAQAAAGRRIAFFGGSFDPPHRGHLAVALAAQVALQLDTVLFAPVGAQPLKPQGSSAGFADRVAMTQLAIAGIPQFAISLVDAPKPSGMPNFTVDTLEGLRAALPSGGELFCLMGADSFAGLSRWRGAAEIPFVAALVVASRPGESLDELRASLPPGVQVDDSSQEISVREGVELRSCLLRNDAGEVAPLFLLPGLDVEISASLIRRRMQELPQGELDACEALPEAVEGYIRSHGLYR